MKKKVLVLLADGFEETEAVGTIDILRRAGLDVEIAGVTSQIVRGSHGISIQTDLLLEHTSGLPDALILPGGMPGSTNLAASKKLNELLRQMNQEKKIIGAICAAPAVVLAPLGILNGRKATCFPGMEKAFPSSAVFSQDRVVVDSNLVTSRSAGTVFDFAFKLVEILVGQDRAQTLKEGMMVKD